METFLSLSIGIGLAAATGFRVFIPLLALSIASIAGYLPLAENFQWIGTYPALTAFATAAAIEIGAYYIPWLDHLMDTLAAPAALIAGAVVMASSITDINPLLKWTLAIIAGSGTAALFHGATSLFRGASTAATGGFGNPLFATAELGISTILSLLAILLPVLAFVVILTIAIFITRWIINRRKTSTLKTERNSTE